MGAEALHLRITRGEIIVVVQTHLTNPFAANFLLTDTNADSILDFIAGKIVVPAHPSAAANAAGYPPGPAPITTISAC